ncbi:MAG: 4-hydroxybenzoate octaprenyltransferase [Deltaproteobacteria bacterium]|nr:MAG: 4-hydroxybenzoate octaprenyltransferase [Deltaproteobacteria bacterium]
MAGIVSEFLEMIKFEHTLFALPFAFVSLLLATRGHMTKSLVFWVVSAMVGARTGAMGFNRVIDAEFDRRNPRTANRAIPAGRISKKAATAISIIAFALFVFSAAMLNTACLLASPLAIAILVGYSFTKRYTAYSHLVLGFAISGAPLGAWLAATGTLSLPALYLSLAVLCWIAGFDILYSLQDVDFDRKTGLHSIPAALGIAPALWVSRLLHLLCVLFLASLVRPLHLGIFYLIGTAIVAVLLIYEHTLISPRDLSRINTAFFTINGLISMMFLAFVALDIYLK